LKDGVFFLQRTEDSYLAKFLVKADGVSHYKPGFDFADGTDINTTGDNISAIKLTNPKITEGKVIPDVPEFQFYSNDDVTEDDELTIMGYP
jgi:hypothetical protein